MLSNSSKNGNNVIINISYSAMVDQDNQIKVQLFISCRKLKDVEILSKSDPFVEVFSKKSRGQYAKLGQTEVIWDNLNPDFIKIFTIDYIFEEQQYLKFSIFDANIEKNIEVKGLQLGEAECTLGEIIGSTGQQLMKTLKLPGHEKSTGIIILRVEEVNKGTSGEISIDFSAKDLEYRRPWCGCGEFRPMFFLSRVMESGANQRIYSSESGGDVNVNWRTLKKTTQELCNSDFSRPLSFELYNVYRASNPKFIGGFEFSIRRIMECDERRFEIRDPKREGNPEYRGSGTVIISQFNTTIEYSFLDYISGGCTINLMIAIDFTGSNGQPSSPDSLHYINPESYNQYQSALSAVSEILLNYDSDKLVPLYGFGGTIKGSTSHCFALNFNEENPSVCGLEGIMNAYKGAISTVHLSGPTHFAPVISAAVTSAEQASVDQMNQQYFILMILTDGQIEDVQKTIDWIVRGSDAPISIIIVGVGNADFQNMVKLDADDVPLVDNTGKKMSRDIVQFVPYRSFQNSPSDLSKEVLAEIPREIVNFFKVKGIRPNQRQVINLENFPDKSLEEVKLDFEVPEGFQLAGSEYRRVPSKDS